jgi:glucose-1-phosphate adenylyltransferase
MGNYMFTTEALVDAIMRDAEDAAATTTWAATSSPRWSSAARRRPRLLQGQRRAGLHRPRPRLLARRRDHRRLPRRAHGPDLRPPDLQPLQPPVADLHLARPAAAGQVRVRQDDRRGTALDSMVCSGVVVSGGTVRRSVLSPGVHVHTGALVEDSVLLHNVDVGRGAVDPPGHHRQERARPGRTPDRRRPGGDRARFHVSDGGVVVIGKDDVPSRGDGAPPSVVRPHRPRRATHVSDLQVGC